MVWAKMKFPFDKRVKLAQGLWLLSWLATVGGALTFCLGCFLKAELRRRAEVLDNNDIHIVPNTLIVSGLASIGINYFAGRICQDALDAGRFPCWKTFLKPYFCCSIFFSSLMLISTILSFAMKGSLEGSLQVGLRNGLRFYKDTDTPGRCFQKQTIDRLQIEFQCCGNNDYKDWFEVQWISNRYLDFSSKEVKDRVKSNVDGRYLLDGVPFSCCNPSSPRPCIQYRLTNNSAHYSYEHQTEELNIFIRGCRDALLSYYMALMNSIGAGVLLVFMLQCAVVASLRYLQTSMEAVIGQENTEIETEGYLLEKSVSATIMEYLDPVMKLLLLNQVQDGTVKAEAGTAGSSGAAPATTPAT
ncbi:rod outer segment membrane protein 1a [Brachyhypopomus gauderio]|uniref:rod outer segment membrane protein 1a n=1 Tax=Brachyhypopomus gauderio TaxID=698409 RepID=UPI004041622C